MANNNVDDGITAAVVTPFDFPCICNSGVLGIKKKVTDKYIKKMPVV